MERDGKRDRQKLNSTYSRITMNNNNNNKNKIAGLTSLALPSRLVLPLRPRHMAHTTVDLPVPLGPMIMLRWGPGNTSQQSYVLWRRRDRERERKSQSVTQGGTACFQPKIGSTDYTEKTRY